MFDFHVVPDSGDAFDVKATSRDVLNWERAKTGRSLTSLMESVNMGDLYTLAYQAAKRTGQFSGNEADFNQTIDLEFLGGVGQAPKATNQAR